MDSLADSGSENSTMYGITDNTSVWDTMVSLADAGSENSTMYGIPDNTSVWDNETILDLAKGSNLKQFMVWYQGIHGYVSIVVCIFGIIFNIMNITVLTQRNMVTPTNYLLTAIAIADMLTLASYLPYAIYFYCLTALDAQNNHPQGWIIYLIFNINFIMTCHMIVIWLTVALAVFRYIVVCHHRSGPNLFCAKITIIAVFIATVLFYIPNYVMYKSEQDTSGHGGYLPTETGFITDFFVLNFWLSNVVLRVVPCVLLTVLSSFLIHAMKLTEKKRQRLKSQGKHTECEQISEHNRTTAMLVAVILCFVIAKLPQGILAFISGVDYNILLNVYIPLEEIWHILILINRAVNFILYCIISRQFRNTFKHVFFSYCRKDKRKTPNGVQNSTIDIQSTKL